MTELAIRVSACTTPLNLEMPELTVTMPTLISSWEAARTTFAAAWMVIPGWD